MGNQIAQGQEANQMPAKIGSVLAITLDATSRRYDLGLLDMGGKGIDRGGKVFVTLFGSVAFYYATSPTNAGTVDETAAVAAGGTPAFGATHCAAVPANTPVRVLLDRVADRYLIVKGSAGILRLYASSDTTGR